MKRLILIISILTFSYGLLLSQDILWEKYYQPNKQIGTTSSYIKTTVDDGLILIAKQINNPMHYPYPIIFKIDNEGNQLWSKFIYTDNYFMDEACLDVTQNNDNSFTIISGINNNPVIEDYWLWFFRFDVSEDGDSLNIVKRNKDGSPYTKGGFNFYRLDDSLSYIACTNSLVIFLMVYFLSNLIV